MNWLGTKNWNEWDWRTLCSEIICLVWKKHYKKRWAPFVDSFRSAFIPNLFIQEKLKDGLHLIDFEQLKIENQTFNEKIEERNEELMKLRKKINNTVLVLTHLKEKLQFVHVSTKASCFPRQLRDSLTFFCFCRERTESWKKDWLNWRSKSQLVEMA